jgi:hypothetical protein
MRHIRLWKGLYCRWNPGCRNQDPIYQRTRELLALQDQLRRQVEECQNDLNNPKNNIMPRLASPIH